MRLLVADTVRVRPAEQVGSRGLSAVVNHQGIHQHQEQLIHQRGEILMPLSIIDYEKVEPGLFNVMMMLTTLESTVAQLGVPTSGHFVSEISRFRNEVALEIERQGTRD